MTQREDSVDALLILSKMAKDTAEQYRNSNISSHDLDVAISALQKELARIQKSNEFRVGWNR